ncbi:CapA family protein [Paenibacillus wynnii]|uniref:CapA family protein n=1 Tax=Paenibacillus wynnii TaxID=268407 RepID=UPI00278E6AAD|nr:CapA family protein [Paenibacillus wynnii]MDQ0191829.1 poly-gamma-glutamate synthesis protein (capsule biosynthesis protein) [Paenibacillus wynnii]
MRRLIVCALILIWIFPASTSVSAEESLSNPIHLIFAGDILLDGFVGDQIDQFGVNYPFVKVAPMLKKADMSFANLETPVSTRGNPSSKSFVFRSEPKTLKGLVYAGIDGVSLANNHVLDYGSVAMLDTLIHLDRNKIGHTGAGKNSMEAFSPYVKTIQGKKIAVLGVSRVLSDPSWYAGSNHAGAASAYTMEPMLSEIKKSSKVNDFTVVYIHWNEEFKDYPENYARTLAKKIIDSGADMIVGAHSHCLMGVEFYKHKPIYYSLGNFVFNRSTRGGDKTLQSMLVNIEIKGSSVTGQITPVKIIRGQPNFMDDHYNKETIKTLNKLSYNAKIDAQGVVSEE